MVVQHSRSGDTEPILLVFESQSRLARDLASAQRHRRRRADQVGRIAAAER